ncbi:MAG: hypothetical protein ACXWUC_12535, partial [Methylosarcina sp.]
MELLHKLLFLIIIFSSGVNPKNPPGKIVTRMLVYNGFSQGLAFPKTVGKIKFCFGEIMKLKIILTGVATT